MAKDRQIKELQSKAHSEPAAQPLPLPQLPLQQEPVAPQPAEESDAVPPKVAAALAAASPDVKVRSGAPRVAAYTAQCVHVFF